MPPAAVAIAGLAVAAVGTGVSIHQQSQARGDARRANRRARRIEAVKAQRSRVQAIRASRVQAASAQAQGAAQGVSGSSITGAVGALQSSTAANIGFANQVDELNRARLRSLSRAEGHSSIAGSASQIAQLGLSAASSASSGGN